MCMSGVLYIVVKFASHICESHLPFFELAYQLKTDISLLTGSKKGTSFLLCHSFENIDKIKFGATYPFQIC